MGLPFGTSLYDLRQREMPPPADLTERDGLNLIAPEAALVAVPAACFVRNPVEAHVVLSGIPDASSLLRRLLDAGHLVIAGRLAGAFRRIGRGDIASEIVTVMKRAGHDVREADPFEPAHALGALPRTHAPIADRLHSLWESMREPVIAAFPTAPGLPEDTEAYLASVDDLYRSDAYHSLSIEGYRVDVELIERVRTGEWDPDNRDGDRRSRDALAARGYWQAFQLVREAVRAVIGGDDASVHARAAHQDWYRELFQPSVADGLVPASALAGYRNGPVYLRRSRHVPPRWESVRDAMPAYFDLLESEAEPSVKAVLGHWLFGYIHPYADGNGRMARFVMNALLASGGYPWTVIHVDDRDAYLAALERASIEQDMEPFARFPGPACRIGHGPRRREIMNDSRPGARRSLEPNMALTAIFPRLPGWRTPANPPGVTDPSGPASSRAAAAIPRSAVATRSTTFASRAGKPATAPPAPRSGRSTSRPAPVDLRHCSMSATSPGRPTTWTTLPGPAATSLRPTC